MSQTHPYTALAAAIHAELMRYYPTNWALERANDLAMACAEPDVRLEDIEQMLRASGERPEPCHLYSETMPGARLTDYQRLQLAGDILSAALRNTNRKLRLEVL